MSRLFAVTGITGNVGGHLADALLSADHRVRGVVRDETSESAQAWKAKGVELAVAAFEDTAALTKTFQGVNGVFVMSPPFFTSSNPREESSELANKVKEAILAAKVPRVVLLSSFGAHLESPAISGPIIKCHDLEQIFFPHASEDLAVVSVRAGYFAENTMNSIGYAKVSSTFSSVLNFDTPIALVTTKDVGIEAAKLLAEKSSGLRIVNVEGPERITYQDIANIFFKLSGSTMPLVKVPTEAIAPTMMSVGASSAMAEMFVSMTSGLDNGSLKFEDGHECIKGSQTFEQFLTEVLSQH